MSADPAMADGLNWYRYANNNPIMYSDPTGMWIDNGDGTHTAEEGDTLHGLYGDNWEEESGWDSSSRKPETLQIGETVGKKRDTSSSDGGSNNSSESEESASSSTQESRRPYIPNDSRHNPPKEHGNNLGQPTNPPPSVSQPAASIEQIEQYILQQSRQIQEVWQQFKQFVEELWDDIFSWWQLAEGAELTARQKQVQNFFGMMAVLLGPILLFFVSQIIAPGSIPLLLHVIWGVMASGSIALSSNKKVILSKEFLLNFSPIVGAIKLKGNKEIAIVNPF